MHVRIFFYLFIMLVIKTILLFNQIHQLTSYIFIQSINVTKLMNFSVHFLNNSLDKARSGVTLVPLTVYIVSCYEQRVGFLI